MSVEGVKLFCEQFHLWCGLPFLIRELWHVGFHMAGKRRVYKAVTKWIVKIAS